MRVYGVPKWFSMRPPSDARLQRRIAQVSVRKALLKILMSSLILVNICPVTTLADGTAHKEAVRTTFDQAVPYVVTGAGWSTSVTVINGGTSEAEITVSFFTSDGKSASLPTVQFGMVSKPFKINIPRGGSFTLDVLPTSTYQINWMYADTWSSVALYSKIRYAQFFDTTQYGRVLLEHQANVQSTFALDTKYLARFDTTNGDDYLILVNTKDYHGDVYVTVTATQDSGQPKSWTVRIPPLNQQIIKLKEVIGEGKGSLYLFADSYFSGAVLDLDGSSFGFGPFVTASSM